MTHIKQRGFTLIELVLVIIILGVVSVGLSGIIGNAMQAVITVNEREQLLREGSFLAERVNREINAAVPNSIRISGNASVHCMEFVPMLFSSLYLNIPLANESGTTADLLELSDIQGNPFVPTSADFAIVNPTQASEVYDASLGQRRVVNSCTDDGDGNCATLDDADSVVQIEVNDGFARTSPAKKLYFARNSVSYCVRNNAVYRHSSAMATNQMLYSSGGSLMAQNVVNVLGPSASNGEQNPFKSLGASFQRNASTQLLFVFGLDDERITFMQEVQIPNVP